MSVFKRNLAEHTDFRAIECYRSKADDGFIVRNNPVMFVDPSGLELRVYNRPAIGLVGWLGGNHAFLYSTDTDRFSGMGGTDERKFLESGRGSYNVVSNPSGVSEKAVMDHMDRTKETGIWFPGINDCHTKVGNAVTHFGLGNPGAPGGRIGSIPRSPYSSSSYGGTGK